MESGINNIKTYRVLIPGKDLQCTAFAKRSNSNLDKKIKKLIIFDCPVAQLAIYFKKRSCSSFQRTRDENFIYVSVFYCSCYRLIPGALRDAFKLNFQTPARPRLPIERL